MNKLAIGQRIQQAKLSEEQQSQLFEWVAAAIEQAIEERAPQRRPPGKAGLRAEKGYYRLLYMEAEFRNKVPPADGATGDETRYHWDHLEVLMGQLTDLPELQTHFMARIDAAVDAVMA